MTSWLLALVLNAFPSHAELTSAELKTPASTRVGELFNSNELQQLMKPQAELDQYFQCHIGTGKTQEARQEALKRFGDFKAKTQNYVKWAAKEFGMPSALAQCMMFRETFFDNSLVSPSGAVSMAQIMGKTYDRVLTRIKKDRDTIQFEREYNDLVKIGVDPMRMTPESNTTENRYIMWQQFAQKKGPYYEQASESEKATSHALAVDELAKYQSGKPLYDSYSAYMNTAFKKLSPSEKKAYFPNSKSTFVAYDDILPSNSTSTLIQNPIMMSGMQMYLMKEMMLRMDYRLSDKMKPTNDPLALMAMIAGGYNAGDEAMLSSLENAKTAVEWCENLRAKGGTETSNYMLSIRRCLMRGDGKQPTGNDPSDKCSSGFYQEGDDPCLPQTVIRPKRRPDNL